MEPWLKTRKAAPNNKEYRQTKQDRKMLDGLYECILCACCSTACPSYWWNQDHFLGPAALLAANRWIMDRYVPFLASASILRSCFDSMFDFLSKIHTLVLLKACGVSHFCIKFEDNKQIDSWMVHIIRTKA